LTHCGQSIFRKISKIVAIRCQVLRLKCKKNSISAGAPPQTPTEELTALPHTRLVYLRGPTSEGRTGKREKRGKRMEEQGE